jgi:hypothetical protein
MAKTKGPAQVYQLKIALRHITPPIWRRVQVKDGTLADVHDVIQASMGWEDYHLHEFDIRGESYGNPEQWEDDFGGESDVGDEGKVKLSQLAAQRIKKINYVYDMGDTWEHVVYVEKALPAEAGAHYPRCVAGERACPPEDCGGPWGYEDVLQAVQGPQTERQEELLEWLGDDGFDPEAFDVEEVNKQLQALS